MGEGVVAEKAMLLATKMKFRNTAVADLQVKGYAGLMRYSQHMTNGGGDGSTTANQ